MTDQHQPPPPYQPPPKKRHTVRNIILVVSGLAVLGLVGCNSDQPTSNTPAVPVTVTQTATQMPTPTSDVNRCREAMKAEYVTGFHEGREFAPAAYGPACAGVDRTTLHRLVDEIIDEIADGGSPASG